MTPYPLHRSEKSTKILITLFLFFMTGSFSVAFLNMYDKVGRVPHGIAERYGPDSESDLTGSASGGIYDTSGTARTERPPALVAKVNTFSALLDLTHPHMFETPLVLLVLCHFLMRTRLANWAKVGTYVLSFAGVAGILATPWLVRYASIRCASLLPVSAVALGLAALVLIFVPLWDMWVRREGRRAAERNALKFSTRYEVGRFLDRLTPPPTMDSKAPGRAMMKERVK
jgi:hypothetical protein